MTRKPLLWLVANRASASNDQETLEKLIDTLGEAGCAADRVLDIQTDSLPTPADLDGCNVGTLAVFAGDGTVNAVVTGLEGWAGQVLVLPGGTKNLLARELHGEDSSAEIVARFAARTLTAVQRPAMRCSAGTALVEMVAGPGATWADVREEMRDGSLGDIASTAIDAAKDTLAGPQILIDQPAGGRGDGYSGVRLSLADAGMAVDGYGAQGIGEHIAQGVALIKRDFREGPHDELGQYLEVACRMADGSPIELMIDGERATGAAQEKFSLAPLAVNLLASGNA